MRLKQIILATICLTSLTTMAQEIQEEINPLSPLQKVFSNDSFDRLIEPTSPILGYQLSEFIRNSALHPAEIVDHIKTTFPQWQRDILISGQAFYESMMAPLEEYCSGTARSINRDQLSCVKPAAIPLEVLTPLHLQYGESVKRIFEEAKTISAEQLQINSKAQADLFQQAKYNCPAAKKLESAENKIKKIFPKRWDRLVDINHALSAAEAAFPRIQFSINGYTQFVYGELLEKETADLASLLRDTYDAERRWLDDVRANPEKEIIPMISYVEEELKNKHLRRDIILTLAYSTRNMPSLDVHYAISPEKALMLETYFWKFNENRSIFSTEEFFSKVFPNKEFERNPGFYHYMTATLLAFEIRCSGFAGQMAKFMALLSKIGYKLDKLIKQVDWKKAKKKGGYKYVKSIAKRQGFGSGVDAGKYGGRYGVAMCKDDLRDVRKAKRATKKAARKDKREERKNK